MRAYAADVECATHIDAYRPHNDSSAVTADGSGYDAVVVAVAMTAARRGALRMLRSVRPSVSPFVRSSLRLSVPRL